MLNITKILLFATMAAVASRTLAETTVATEIEPTEILPQMFEPTEMLSEMLDIGSDSVDDIYHYVCTVGNGRTNFVMCVAEDSTNWNTPHNVELRLRCPKTGTGKTVAFAQVDVFITSRDIQCQLTQGGVGYGFIELLVTAKNTMSFKYTSDIYSTF